MLLRLFRTLLLVVVAPLAAQSPPPKWPQFRGVDGAAAATSASTLTFERERDVLWRVDLPPGHSSPCIWGEQIFLTAHDGGELAMLAFDRADGKQLWRRAVPAPERSSFDHVDVSLAMPTPCTNGERVFFYFGTHGLVVTDTEGELAWEKRLPASADSFGVGTSPILAGDAVIVVRDGCPDAAIRAFDEETGAERWSVPRVDYYTTHATPFLWRHEGSEDLVVASSGRLQGFDPKNGKARWHVDGLTTVVCTSPAADRQTLYFGAWSTPGSTGRERLDSLFGDAIADDELADGRAVFAKFDADHNGRIEREELPDCRAKDAFEFADRNGDGALEASEFVPLLDGPKRGGENVMVAVTAGGSGDVTKSHVRWRHQRNLPYVSSPLLNDGRIYMVKAGGVLTCLDADSGKQLFTHRLDDHSEYYASPVAAGDQIVVCSSHGTIYVLAPGPKAEITTQIELGDGILATPAIVDGTVYLRSKRALWAFGRH